MRVKEEGKGVHNLAEKKKKRLAIVLWRPGERVDQRCLVIFSALLKAQGDG